jgi:hypothetical protein
MKEHFLKLQNLKQIEILNKWNQIWFHLSLNNLNARLNLFKIKLWTLNKKSDQDQTIAFLSKINFEKYIILYIK